MHLHLVTFICILLSTSCKHSSGSSDPTCNTAEASIQEVASSFFKTFSDRSDWDTFCAYYNEDMVFEDIILQLKLDSLWKFKRFYKWDDDETTFKKLSPEQKHLELYSLVCGDNIAVARGHVNPFYYGGELVDSEWGMEFTIWLYFDDQLKIKKQVDWFEYDGYTLESMIKRCREKGFQTIPDWLDLSNPPPVLQ